MHLLDRLCSLFGRAPEPPKPAPLPAQLQRKPKKGSPRDLESQAEVSALESAVHQASVLNDRVSMASIKESHTAISAEERSRSMLDELMRAMDRGC